MNSRKGQNNKAELTIKSKISQDLGESQLNVENNKSIVLADTVAPKKGHQTDDYEGPVDPLTRLRHGLGTYRYPNKFFTFEGNYNQGVKQGRGMLRLRDGTVINGMFVKNELTGDAEISYPDGSTYKGSLRLGEKSGFGIFKSRLEQYEGQYLENKRHGSGRYRNGNFQNNKPWGQNIQIRKYNYQYRGSCVDGFKSGTGVEISTYLDDNYRYEGQFSQDKFEGHGFYINNSPITYRYQGDFKNGHPALYPNEFRISIATATGLESPKPSPESYVCVTTEQTLSTPIEYELQSEIQLYLLVQSCYQGPQQLDPNQPTEQEIDKMVKDWQNQNKKNKNPPPMPDFRQPRKIKPALLLVEQESQRPIQVRLTKAEPNENNEYFKIDYRESIRKKRSQNELLRAEAAKKAEEEGNKKGGKGPAKSDLQLKVNVFVPNPSPNQSVLQVHNEKGRVAIQKIEFPDDFPPGSYSLIFRSPFDLFGPIKQIKKPINIKAKNAGGKKK